MELSKTKILSMALLTLGYISLLVIFWNTVSADESYVAAKAKAKEGNFERALNYANKSVKKNPYESRYYYGNAKVLLASTISAENAAKVTELKSRAYTNMQKAEKLNPKNLVTLRNNVPLYYFLATKDLAQPADPLNIDPQYLEIAKKQYHKLKNSYSNDVGVLVLIAKYEKRLYLDDMYADSLGRIEKLRPDLLEWHPNLQ